MSTRRKHSAAGRGLSALVGVVVVALAIAMPHSAEAQRKIPVQVDEVRSEPLDQTLPILGRFVARQTGPIAAETAGAVAEVTVQPGDRVEAGDTLAVLIADRLDAEVARRRAAVASAEAKIRTARARLAQSQQELERLQRLRQSAAFSQARFDDAEQSVVRFRSEVGEAEADHVKYRAELRLAEIDLEKATIRAPYGGVVTLRHTESGAYVQPGSPVVTLLNDRELEIEADVPASRIGGVRPGLMVEASLDDGERYPAMVRAVIPNENAMTRTRAVRFTPRFRSPPALSAVNSTVTVHLPTGRPREVVSVHKDAVVQRGGPVVFRVEDGKAAESRVRLGEGVGNRFEVLSGLEPGDLAVVRGNERLQSGQALDFTPPEGWTPRRAGLDGSGGGRDGRGPRS